MRSPKTYLDAFTCFSNLQIHYLLQSVSVNTRFWQMTAAGFEVAMP